MKTATKRDLMEMLKNVPDDANVYVMTSKTDASRAAEAATGEDLVFILGGNTAFEADGVSLVADFNCDRKSTMTAIPTLDALKALHGKNFAMLSADEQAVLRFYRDQGRKFDVAVAILSDADPKELERASREQADEIMRRANSHVRITIGENAQQAWASRAH